MTDRVETVVIGGGQAGLAMSCHLSQRGAEHIVVERARVAERWRSQRWDSLMFQFPNWSIELPGRRYLGEDPDGFSHRDEIVRFIEDYAACIKAPLRAGVNVLSLRPAARTDRYIVVTDHGNLEARNVVVATGPYQVPQLPQWSSGLPTGLVRLHASEYRNPAALPAGAVLVVGSGASGCQIAEELAEAGRRVYLSVGRHRRVPRRYRGRDVFWWRRALGHLDQIVDETPDAQRIPPPLVTGVRGGHDVDLRAYAAKGMTLLGEALHVRDGRLALAPNLADNLRAGDQAFAEFTRVVDDYVRKSGLGVPSAADSAAPCPNPATLEPSREIGLGAAGIRSVIWATGYGFDFDWIELPIFDGRKRPAHRGGVTASPGIYFLGLPWLRKAKSSFLYGVGEDAEHLAGRISRAAH